MQVGTPYVSGDPFETPLSLPGMPIAYSYSILSSHKANGVLVKELTGQETPPLMLEGSCLIKHYSACSSILQDY